MDHSDQLLTFAELAIALAGFSGIIATYQFKQEEYVSRGRVLGLSMIVNISLLAALFSVLPLALLNLGFSERSVWAFSSGLAGFIWIAFTIFIGHNMTTYRVRKPARILFAFLFFVSAIASVVLLLNAFGIILHQTYAPYFAAFLLAFFMVCFNFSRLLMHPLWRALRENEVARAAVD
jgi:hypothetical protein